MKRLLVYLLVVFVLGCSGMSQSPEQIFQQYLAANIPSGVSELTGKSNAIGGFSANLVFLSDKNTFISLTKGYKPLDHGTAMIQAQDWFDDEVKNNSKMYCYFKKVEDSEMRMEYYLFWNDKNNKTYFSVLQY